ncbi:MAG: hypothetical protein SGPRY_000493 [Prymnesium sp.]
MKESLVAWGLPVGANAARSSHAPPSPLVGLSCLLFWLCALHSYSHHDPTSSLLAVVVSLFSLSADVVNHVSGWRSPLAQARACAFDRACATTFALWLVRIAVFQLGPVMLLSLVPLALVLSYSRASTTRGSWIRRHSFWHLFCAIESTCIMQVVYESDSDGNLRAHLNDLHHVLKLIWAPISVGILLLLHGVMAHGPDWPRLVTYDKDL